MLEEGDVEINMAAALLKKTLRELA